MFTFCERYEVAVSACRAKMALGVLMPDSLKSKFKVLTLGEIFLMLSNILNEIISLRQDIQLLNAKMDKVLLHLEQFGSSGSGPQLGSGLDGLSHGHESVRTVTTQPHAEERRDILGSNTTAES